MTGYDYGNARLRARKSSFFDTTEYRSLAAAADIDGLLGALSASRYRPDVEAALPRFESMRRLDGAIAINLGRTLGEMQSFYRDEPGRAVTLLLERWDVRNLQAVLRGLATRATPAQVLATTVPTGTLTAGVLRTLAGAPDLRSLLDLMATLGVPDSRGAVELLEAWPTYESTGDPAQLELALHGVYANRWQTQLAELDLPSLRRLFTRETDRVNVLAALRMFDVRQGGADRIDALAPGPLGTVAESTLIAAAMAASREAAASVLSGAVPAAWSASIEEWSGHGMTAVLGTALDAAVTRELAALFVRGDPLSIDVPVAFTATLENEARNLRMIGRGVAAGLPPTATLDRLVTPW